MEHETLLPKSKRDVFDTGLARWMLPLEPAAKLNIDTQVREKSPLKKTYARVCAHMHTHTRARAHTHTLSLAHTPYYVCMYWLYDVINVTSFMRIHTTPHTVQHLS